MRDAPSDRTPAVEGYRPIGSAAASLCILLAALWGGAPVAISYSVDTLPPVAVAGLRFVLATLFMLFWCRAEGTDLSLRPGQLTPSLVLGLLLFAQIALFTYGVRESNSSHATLFINTFIFWVAAIEHFVTRTARLSLARWLGLLLAGAGVVLILGTTEPPAASDMTDGPKRDVPTLFGDAFLLASAVLLAAKLIYTKAATRRVEPGKLIFWHDLIGVGLFAIYSAVFETTTWRQFTVPAVLGLLYQGLVVAGFCFAVQAHLLKRHSASQIAVFSFLTPLFGIAISVLFRGDPLSPWLLVSGGCVAAGILIVTRPLPKSL